jgi:hypothetical protein
MQLKRSPQLGGNNIVLPVLPAANFAAPWTAIIPIDRDMYLWGLDLNLRFRLTTAVAPGAAVNAEAAFGLIRRVRVVMNHEIFGNKTFINLAGSTLYRRAHIFGGVPPTAIGGIAVGNAAYDCEVHYPIPFVVESVYESEQIGTLLDAPRCSSLQVEIDFGVGTDLVQTGGGTTYAFAAFGGGGNPELTIEKLLPLGFKGSPLRPMVQKFDVVNPIAAAQTEQQRIGNEIPTGDTIRMLMLKQYVQDAATAVPCAQTMTSPVLAAAAGMTSIQIKRNSQPIREYRRWRDCEFENQWRRRLAAWPAGYTLFDFAEFGTLNDALYTQDYPANKTRLEVSGLVNALAANVVEFIYDVVLPNPKM